MGAENITAALEAGGGRPVSAPHYARGEPSDPLQTE